MRCGVSAWHEWDFSDVYVRNWVLWLDFRETKAHERRGWCYGLPAGCLRGCLRDCAVERSCGLDALHGGPDVMAVLM